MRYTQKRNGVNEIPLLNAVCGIDMPYWRIDRHDSLRSYLSGDAADKLAAYEDAEEQGLLVRLPCKVGDTVYRICHEYKQGNPFIRAVIFNQHNFWRIVFGGEFGKTVFLTREEAEAALKGERDDV